MNSDSGFTLVEMLVGLLVLSFASLALSTTLSSAFESHQRIEASANEMAEYDQLEIVLRDIGRSQFLQPNADPGLADNKISLANAGSLSIEREKDKYVLLIAAEMEDGDIFTVFESEYPIRFKFTNAAPKVKGRLALASSPRRALIIELDIKNKWESIISVPLLASVKPDCRYDIVGRRCR